MRFPALILKNLWRRKTRSSLAIIGISIGIATIIALGAVSDGLSLTMEAVLRPGKADFTIAEEGVADMMFSRVDEEKTGEIEEVDGVMRVAGVLVAVYPVGDNQFFPIFGVKNEDLPIFGAEIVEGGAFIEGENEIMIGRPASKQMNRSIGDKLGLGDEEFQIVGVFETGSIFIDKGAALPLKTLQRMQRKEGDVTIILVELEIGADIGEVCQQIEEDYPGLVTIKSVAEFSKVDKGLEMVNAATWSVSLLATVIGGTGVMNAMMMSVFERTREVGVLRAVGWKRKRILGMILGESILLCLFAIPLGALMGVLGVKLLTLNPVVGGFLEPIYTLDNFARALCVALLVGLVGGLYPAYRASRLSPSEALRYE